MNGPASLRTVLQSRLALASAAIVLGFLAVGLFAPLICGALGVSPSDTHTELVGYDGFPLQGPSLQHPFGLAPATGRDLFARWVYGARYSMLIAISVATAATGVGLVVGIVAGYFGGWVDRVCAFAIDLFLTMPFLLIAAVVGAVITDRARGGDAAAFDRHQLIAMVVLLFTFGWMGLARVVRAQVLALREQDFVLAARSVGCSHRRVLIREILPHLTVPIVLGLSMGIPAVIATEAGLSILGVGLVDLPTWGATIRDATRFWRADPLYLWEPVLGIVVLVLCLNLLADVVHTTLDPKSRNQP